MRPSLITLILLLTFATAAQDLPFVRVSQRDHRYFETTDGRPFIPIGLNLIAPPRSRQMSEEESLRRFEGWLQKLSANGGNYIRIWLSNDFWDIEPEKAGVYDEQKAKRIDAALALCRRYGIRAKLTIEHFREIDPAKTGTTWAMNPRHHISRGGTAESMTQWLSSDFSREQFKRKLDFFARRHGDDPTVFGWELWNEVNAVRASNYMEWTEVMLGELHRRFPKNLCMQSLGSFDRAGSRNVYRRHSVLAANDLAQVHRYLDMGAELEVCHGPMDVLCADAIEELKRFEPKKPVILAESGAVEPRHTGPFKLYEKDKAGVLLHDLLFAPFFAGAAGPGQAWHWDSYVDRNGLWHHFKAFADVVEGIDPIAEGFTSDLVEHPQLRIYQLAGKKQTLLLWLRDKENTWKRELEEGVAPRMLSGVRLDIPMLRLYLGPGTRIRVYDPWVRDWKAIPAGHDTIPLPDFSRSLIVRIERDALPQRRPRPGF